MVEACPEDALADRVAIVTGGTSGIGAAVVRQLAGLGCRVISLGRDRSRAEALGRSLGQGFIAPHFVQTNLRRTDGLRAIVDEAAARFGRIDILINNAGATGPSASILGTLEADWDASYALNIKAPFLLLQAAARHMVAGGRGGRIVNLSSSSAFRARYSSVAYSTAKAALAHLTRSAAAELGPHDINVNTVVPGATRTGMTAGMGEEGLKRAVMDGPLANLLQRPSEAEDVANMITFLCLPQSRQITGQTLHVSAGAVI